MLCNDEKNVDYCLSLGNDNYDCIHNVEEKSFELYSKTNTKATGILKALEYLDIPIENSYAFGDGITIAEAIKYVATKINSCKDFLIILFLLHNLQVHLEFQGKMVNYIV